MEYRYLIWGVELLSMKSKRLIPRFWKITKHPHCGTGSFLCSTYSIGSPSMQRVPKPGLFTKDSTTWDTSVSFGMSLLYILENIINANTRANKFDEHRDLKCYIPQQADTRLIPEQQPVCHDVNTSEQMSNLGLKF